MMNIPTTALFSAAIALGSDAVVPAQQLPEGLGATTQPLSATTSLVLTTSSGLVAFDGTTVTLTPPGLPPQPLLQLPAFAFGSFLLQTGPAHVLFACTGSQDTVWLLPLQGPMPSQPLATIAFNYDATTLTPNTALVSAKTGGFGAGNNDLLVLDLTTGAVQLVASVPGASGPVVTAANGDLYYATSSPTFPTPPGQVQILRFPRPVLDAAIIGNLVLGPVHANVAWSGIDTASDLAFDDDGDLLFVDWLNARIGEVSDAGGPSPWLAAPIADYTGAAASPTTLQFVAGAGAGVFEPFQPANGALLVHETDFFAISQLRSLRGAPASLGATGTSPHPVGPFDVVATAGPALGIGIVGFDISSAPGTLPLFVPGFEQPLLWSMALIQAPVFVLIPFDASGGALLTIGNPGFAPPIAATVQIAHISTIGVLGATAPLLLLIAQ